MEKLPTMSTKFALSKTLRPKASESPRRTVRIVILGQSAVGKTAMAVRFVTKRFIGEYDPTLETIYRHEVSVGGEVVQYEILDTAGQHNEDALVIDEKIRWADAFLVAYSVTDRCSFLEAQRLCFLVRHLRPSPPLLLAANQRDLERDRMVRREEGAGLAAGLRLPFREVSAREGAEETARLFLALGQGALRRQEAAPLLCRRWGTSRLMERVPCVASQASRGQNPASRGQDQASRGQDQASQGQDQASRGQNQASLGQNQASPHPKGSVL